MQKNIPYSRQDINEDDIQSVVDVLRSDHITQGPRIAEFENTVKTYCSADYAVAVTNGTAALHLTLLALNIDNKSRVWASPLSFIASANSVIYTGAKVDFVDIESSTGNMDIEKLVQKLEEAQLRDELPDVVMPFHYGGSACNIESMAKLAKDYNFKIIENADHALGGSYKDGSKIGSSLYSTATIFSFHPTKSITTGEGGMVLTNDKQLATRVKLLRSHGASKDINLMQNEPDGGWYYEQIELGYNYRITDIQAALGISQMKRLTQFVNRRRMLANRYRKILSNLPVILPQKDENSAWHIYPIQLAENAKVSKKDLFFKMRQEGIGVNVHFIPIHMQPYYQNMGFKEADFPNSEDFYHATLSLPLYPALKEIEQDIIVEKLTEFLC